MLCYLFGNHMKINWSLTEKEKKSLKIKTAITILLIIALISIDEIFLRILIVIYICVSWLVPFAAYWSGYRHERT